ncbi:MAG: NYN domain-containing protein [Candidatus Saccharicenans sp.]|nr:NYN domain-containing protein [Candidatus Saccharicenans sp.]
MNEKSKPLEKKYSFLLVDGYNLIHQMPEISRHLNHDLQRARELLIIKLANFATRNQLQITLVFDGQNLEFADHASQPGVKVIFSKGVKADLKIKELASRLARDNRKKDWLVVTSDFDIGYYVEGLGLKTESSRAFASRLQAEESKIKKKMEAKRNRVEAEPEEKKLPARDREWIYSVFMEKKK